MSCNGYLICTFTSIFNWFNISDLLDVYKDPMVVNSPVLVQNLSVNHDNLLRQGLIAYRVGDLH